jgi:hypothetical protein
VPRFRISRTGVSRHPGPQQGERYNRRCNSGVHAA